MYKYIYVIMYTYISAVHLAVHRLAVIVTHIYMGRLLLENEHVIYANYNTRNI